MSFFAALLEDLIMMKLPKMYLFPCITVVAKKDKIGFLF